MTENKPFEIPGISEEEMKKVREDGAEINKNNETDLKEGTELTGRNLKDALDITKNKD